MDLSGLPRVPIVQCDPGTARCITESLLIFNRTAGPKIDPETGETIAATRAKTPQASASQVSHALSAARIASINISLGRCRIILW